MKRKIALVLAAAMTVSMLPMNAFAASTNSISATNVSVKTDVTDSKLDVAEVLSNGNPIALEVTPRNEVASGASIIINIENGKFDAGLIKKEAYAWKSVDGKDWDFMAEAINSSAKETKLINHVGGKNSRQLPYKINYLNANSIEVELYEIADGYVGQNNSTVTKGTPLYKIALPVDVKDSNEGDVKIEVEQNGSSVSEGTYTIANVTANDGSTTASVVSSDITVTSDDNYILPNITIREDVTGTFEVGKEITLKTNGKYTFTNPGRVYGLVQYTFDEKTTGLEVDENGRAYIVPKLNNNSRTLTFALPAGMDKYTRSSITIEGVRVETDNEESYGDINITVDGEKGITRQTLKVGERADYGFYLTALEEATTIYAGRSFLQDGDLDEEDFATAEFEFGETTPGTWLTGRKLEFSVPEGVKIIGYDITKSKYINDTSFLNDAVIVDDGTTLRFSAAGNSLNESESSYFNVKLYLSAAATFSGDVNVAVSGAGLDKDQITDLTVAKVITPVTVETSSTAANLGYKAVSTADIKITENAYGALIEGEQVKITLDSTYSSDIAFTGDDVRCEVEGELEVKNFRVSNGALTFTVDSESYDNPSTITIQNVEVGTTRSIPYGSYGIIVGGGALVNNDTENVDSYNTVRKATISDVLALYNADYDSNYRDFDMFEEEGFEFKDYLSIKTATNTLDGKVEVTIGSKTINMDGSEVDMDTAAYIQTASNSTMVPLRFVSLAIGVDQDSAAAGNADNSSNIAWDATTKTATIFFSAGSAQKIVQFQADSPIMKVDGTAITMEYGVKAEIVDGRMFVPFRALGQALGVPVSWDAETRTAIYN